MNECRMVTTLTSDFQREVSYQSCIVTLALKCTFSELGVWDRRTDGRTAALLNAPYVRRGITKQWGIANFAPLEQRTRLSWRLLTSRIGCSQYHIAGVLGRTRQWSDAAAVASRRHTANCINADKV